MKILIIEDDKIKIDKLSTLLAGNEIIISEAFQPGLMELRQNYFDLLILDMTMPLWERTKNDISQHYEQLGGEKILREMKRKNITIPVILFTMFDKFPIGDEIVTFNQINEKYLEHYDFYVGGVYYDSIQDNWKTELQLLINSLHES